jgi:hypothetical protein
MQRIFKMKQVLCQVGFGAPRLRHFGTPEQRRAHVLLDRVMAGKHVQEAEVRRALRALGEKV